MWYRGGGTRSSDEVTVMAMEQRGVIIQPNADNNWKQEDLMQESKPYNIPKKVVIEAYRRVKANKGSAGIDGMDFEEFEKHLNNNMYKSGIE